MSDKYKNEPFNTPEQKIIELTLAHKNALEKTQSLEAKVKELEKENKELRGSSCDLNFDEGIQELEAFKKEALEVMENILILDYAESMPYVIIDFLKKHSEK